VLLALGVLAVLFCLVVVPWFFTHVLTKARFSFPDPEAGKTPKSHGLDFEWAQFRSLDGIPLRGWYIPAAGKAQGTIVYCHGLNRTRVELLPQAVFAHALGYHGLLFDFRHSGQSGGELTTLGYQERLDVLGAVRYALVEKRANSPIVLWGISMGAAAALLAAAESSNVNAVISDSAFVSLSETIRHHARLLLRIPAFPIADVVIYWTARRGGFRPSDFDLRNAVERMGQRPILFVAVEGDRRMPPSKARALYLRAASPRARLVILPGTRHGEGFRAAGARYQEAVKEFLRQVHSEAGR